MAGSHKSGAYDCVTNIALFMKRKRKVQCVILHNSLLPRKCANPKCKHGGIVQPDPNKKCNSNRTDLMPASRTQSGKIGVACMHYDCSWECLLDYVYGPLYDKIMGY